MKSKFLLGLGLAALATLSLVSCKPDNEEGDKGGTSQDDPYANIHDGWDDQYSKVYGGAFDTIPSDYQAKTNKLLVWGPDTQLDVLKHLTSEWSKELKNKTGIEVTVEVGLMAETEVSEKLANDLEACADVFAFANDNLVKFVSAGYIQQQGGDRAEYAHWENDLKGTVSATAPDNKMYAYPFTGDNGYFLMYDKSKFTAEDVKHFDNIWEKASSTNRLHLDLDDSWYDAGFFFGTGCSYKVTYNDQNLETSITCDFNDSVKGMAAGKAILDIYNQGDKLSNGDNTVLQSGLTGKTVGAAITGTWNYPAAKAAWGDNFEATKLPEFRVDGVDYQMGSFNGYKLMGVNKKSDDQLLASSLAAYLTCKESQVYRYEQTGVAPSIEEARNEADGYSEDKCASALTLQASQKTARVQESVPSNYWSAVETFAKEIIQGEVTEANMQEKLNQMAKLISTIKTEK